MGLDALVNSASIQRVLNRCWRNKVTVSSDFARGNATIIAMAASMVFLSTKVGDRRYSNQWHITPQGLHWLMEQE